MFAKLFDKETCGTLMPPERSDEFFEALFGDAREGAYDIELRYASATSDEIRFELLLHQRPGHCLACNLTQGLPQVFSRHPLINVAGMVAEINSILGDRATTGEWQLGYTEQRSSSLHVIPLNIQLN